MENEELVPKEESVLPPEFDFLSPKDVELLKLIEEGSIHIDKLLDQFWLKFQPQGIQKRILDSMQDRRDDFLQVVVSGGNQIGKSMAGLAIMRDALLRENKYRDWPKNRKIVIYWITETERFQLQTIQDNFKQYCPDIMAKFTHAPSTQATKAWTQFHVAANPMGFEDTVNFGTFKSGLETARGFTADAVFIDEGQTEYKFFEILTQRVMRKRGLQYWCMEPDSKMLPVYDKVFEPAIVGVQHDQRKVIMGTFEDYLEAMSYDYETGEYDRVKGEANVAFIEATMSKEEYNKRCKSEWGSGEGLVYPFQYDKHVCEEFPIPWHWRKDIFGDYANSNSEGSMQNKKYKMGATATGWIACPPPGENVVINGINYVPTVQKPIYIIYEEYYTFNRKLGNEHGDEIIKKCKPEDLYYSIIFDFLDLSAAHLLKQSFAKIGFAQRFKIAENRAKTKSINSTTGKTQGIEKMRQVIGENRLFIFRKCRNWISEASNYYWDKKKPGHPQDHGDHLLDGTKNYLNTQPGYISPSPNYKRLEEDEDPNKKIDYDGLYFGSEKEKVNIGANIKGWQMKL